MRHQKHVFFALGAIFIGALAAMPASAGEGDSIFTVSESKNETFIDAGIGTVIREPYVGSEETDVIVLPYVNAQYEGRFYINPATGIGAFLINNDSVRLGTGVNIATGRDAVDVPVLGVAGELDTALTANVSARYFLPFAALDVIGTVPVTGDVDGAQLDVFLTTQFFPVKELRINPGVRTTFQSSGWANSYYGISAAQSASANIAALDYSSGLTTLGAHVAAFYTLSDNIEIVGGVNYSWLKGDVKDSPLTPKNSGATFSLAIARKF